MLDQQMQPSIPLGTVLQDRYRITKILGQGGFGRTYLAEDRGRFNELCALKETHSSSNRIRSGEVKGAVSTRGSHPLPDSAPADSSVSRHF